MDPVDLIIVGAGTSGIPAAITAADRGARVVLLEKRDIAGGMLFVSGGQFSGAGTRLQQARGIADTPEQHADDVMRIAHGKANRPLVDVSVRQQGPMVDWLTDLNFEFRPDVPITPFGHETYRLPRTYMGVEWGRSLLRLFQKELATRVESGTIDLRLNTRVTRLLQDESGRITGVEAVVANGETVTISARNVLLATGGFAANPALIARFAPPEEQDFLAACLDYAVGDGLNLGEQAGAGVTSYLGSLPSVALIPDPDRPGFTLHWHKVHLVLPPQVRTPYEIWINRAGERFMAEDVPSAESRDVALLAQPDRFMAVVWDERILNSAPVILENDPLDWTADRIREEAARGAFIKRADTLAELATLIGVDADGLERTVAAYNQSVVDGIDPAFGRTALPLPIAEAPYYAITSRAGIMLSREGLTVDTDLRVLDTHGTPIEGLYAVGEVLGASQLMGDSFVSGMSVGPAIAFGRMLGERLANPLPAGAA